MSTFRSFAELKASLEYQPKAERPVEAVAAQVAERLWAQQVADGR